MLDTKKITPKLIKSYLETVNDYFNSNSNPTVSFIKGKLLSIVENNNTQINQDKVYIEIYKSLLLLLNS